VKPETMNNKMTVEIWSMCAAVNIKKALPLIEPLLTEQINIKTLAMKIERKYRNQAQWNKSVNERCLPAIKMILILQ